MAATLKSIDYNVAMTFVLNNNNNNNNNMYRPNLYFAQWLITGSSKHMVRVLQLRVNRSLHKK